MSQLERFYRRAANRLRRAADFWDDAAEAADEEPGRRYSREARGARREADGLDLLAAVVARGDSAS